jgi:hypothetical protein
MWNKDSRLGLLVGYYSWSKPHGHNLLNNWVDGPLGEHRDIPWEAMALAYLVPGLRGTRVGFILSLLRWCIPGAWVLQGISCCFLKEFLAGDNKRCIGGKVDSCYRWGCLSAVEGVLYTWLGRDRMAYMRSGLMNDSVTLYCGAVTRRQMAELPSYMLCIERVSSTHLGSRRWVEPQATDSEGPDWYSTWRRTRVVEVWLRMIVLSDKRNGTSAQIRDNAFYS